MVATMVIEFQRSYQGHWLYEMNLDLVEKFHKTAFQEKYEVFRALMACKLKEGELVCIHIKMMQRYMECLERLNMNVDEELAIDMVL